MSIILGIVLREPAFAVLPAVAILMIVPFAGVYRARKGWGRITLAIYSGLMGTAGVAAFISAWIGTTWSWGLAAIPAGLFLLGWCTFFWIAWLILSSC